MVSKQNDKVDTPSHRCVHCNKRKHYKSLLMLEGLWGAPGSDLGNASVRHFVEGIAKYHNVPMYYSNFIGLGSFKLTLQHLAQAQDNFQILYIGAHGSPGTLGNAQHARACQAIKKHSRNIKIVIFGSCCGAANENNIVNMMTMPENGGTTPNLFFGYRYYMNWMETTLVDCQIINACLANENNWGGFAANNSRAIICPAVSAFNKAWNIGSTNPDFDNDMTLGDSLVAFNRGQGAQDPVKLDNLF